MPNIYCHHCGKQLELGARFCSKCGTSLAALSNIPEPPQEIKRPKFAMPAMGNQDNDDDDGDSVQHFNLRMNALAVDINVPEIAERMEIGLPSETKKAGRPKKSKI